MGCGGGASVQGAACLISLVIAYSSDLWRLFKCYFQILFELQRRDLDQLWLVQQIILLDYEPVRSAVFVVFLEKAVCFAKINELEINEEVSVLVKYPQAFDVAFSLHFLLLLSPLGAQELLADFETAQLRIVVNFSLHALLCILLPA